MATAAFQAPKGTRDVLPPESDRQRALIAEFARQAVNAGYGQVVSPIFEDIRVFHRLGDSTDVVTKEMYDFRDKDDRHLALRPELTASIVRAFVQHRPALPWKAWYEGPQFRHEKPQAGRYRQFTQVGVEVLGTDDPHVDVEVIALAWRFYEAIGLRQVRLLLNTLGDPECRPAYFDALGAYLNDHAADLSEQSRATLAVNPLRVLDSKRPPDQDIIAGAPLMVDYLSEDAAASFGKVTDGLQTLGIPYEISPRLVRGLDYYVKTTFEFVGDALDGSQNAVGGGGRYDNLAEQLGGPATPGIGFALGIDRILMACDAEEAFPGPATAPQVFVVDVSGGGEALVLCDQLRQAGYRADRSFGGRSMKAQMKVADRSGAELAFIVGEDELAAGTVTVRHLRSDVGQSQLQRSELLSGIAGLLTNEAS